MKKTALILTIILLTLSLTGCWSSRELSDAAFLAGAAYEKKGEEYKITFQVLRPTQIKNQQSQAFVMISSSGPTVQETVRRLVKGLKRRLFLTQNRVLVIDSKLAEENILPVLDFVYREQQFRLTSYIYIADGAAKLLGQQSPLDPMSSFGLSTGTDTVKNDVSEMPAVTLKEFIEMHLGPTATSYVTLLKMHHEEKPAMSHLDINGTGIIKQGKLVKRIESPTTTRGILWFHDLVSDGIMTINMNKQDKAGIDILKAKSKITPRLQNGKLIIDVEVKVIGDLQEWESPETIDEKMIKKIEKLFTVQVRKEMEEALTEMRKDPVTDVSQIGLEVYRQMPDYWHQINKDWDEHFKNLQVNLKVDAKIKNMGLIQNNNSNHDIRKIKPSPLLP